MEKLAAINFWWVIYSFIRSFVWLHNGYGTFKIFFPCFHLWWIWLWPTKTSAWKKLPNLFNLTVPILYSILHVNAIRREVQLHIKIKCNWNIFSRLQWNVKFPFLLRPSNAPTDGKIPVRNSAYRWRGNIRLAADEMSHLNLHRTATFDSSINF